MTTERDALVAKTAEADAELDAIGLRIDSVDAAIAAVRAAPTLQLLSFYAKERGSEDVTLTVTGLNFVSGGTAIRINGTPVATTVVDADTAQTDLSDSLFDAVGTVTVDLVTTEPGGGASSERSFAVINGDPVVVSLTPSSVAAGAGDTVLTVGGTWLYANSVVRLNGTAVSTVLVGDELVCTVPAALLAQSGVGVSVTVFNPTPGGGLSTPSVLAVT